MERAAVEQSAGAVDRAAALNPHPFRQGELMQAGLELLGFTPGAGLSPAEQWQFTGLLLDPPTTCGTVAKPCYLNEPGGVGFGIVSGARDAWNVQSLALNSRQLPSSLITLRKRPNKVNPMQEGSGCSDLMGPTRAKPLLATNALLHWLLAANARQLRERGCHLDHPSPLSNR